jgi:hypothetical protein
MSNLKEELESVRYNDLKVKFAELGVGEVFRAGIKKDVLIETAIKLIEKKESSKEEVRLEEVEAEEIIIEEKAQEVALSKFDEAVKAVVNKDGVWTKDTIEKRINILGNVFNQHRGTVKGKEALAKKEILVAASKLMF